MANKFGSFLKKRLIGKNRNLMSFDEPFEVMPSLLKGHRVTGIIDAQEMAGYRKDFLEGSRRRRFMPSSRTLSMPKH